MQLVWPAAEYLASYEQALRRGWSPDNLRPEVALDEITRIGEDADSFLASLVDREARGPAVVLPDGSTVPLLPGYRRWMWDGEFCGSIGFRWQRGTSALRPPAWATSAIPSSPGSGGVATRRRRSGCSWPTSTRRG